MKPLVIYHGACIDGFCAAWVVNRALKGDADFHAGLYGQGPPDVRGRDVVMVDFSYPRPVLETMAALAKTLLVLDHHKTAEAALRGFEDENTKFRGGNAAIHFDMNRSGAGMAWDHYYPGQPRPFLVDYVEDRDLWRKALPDTDVVNAYIGTLPFTFEAYDGALLTSAQDGWEVADPLSWARMMGRGALARMQQYVREVVKNARVVRFEGYDVPLVNAPQVGISELLDARAEARGWRSQERRGLPGGSRSAPGAPGVSPGDGERCAVKVAMWTRDGRRFEEEIPGKAYEVTPMNIHREVQAPCDFGQKKLDAAARGPWPRLIRFRIKRYCEATGCVVYEEQQADAETARAS